MSTEREVKREKSVIIEMAAGGNIGRNSATICLFFKDWWASAQPSSEKIFVAQWIGVECDRDNDNMEILFWNSDNAKYSIMNGT